MSVECVAADNKLVSRELILLELAASWGIRWMLEQPVPNLMIQHPMSAWKLKRLGEGCLVAGKELWGTRPRWYLCLWQRRILRGPKLLDLSLKFRRRAIATSPGGQRHQMAGLFVTGGPVLKQTKSYPAILGVQLALARNKWLDAGMHFAKKARALHPIARLATQSPIAALLTLLEKLLSVELLISLCASKKMLHGKTTICAQYACVRMCEMSVCAQPRPCKCPRPCSVNSRQPRSDLQAFLHVGRVGGWVVVLEGGCPAACIQGQGRGAKAWRYSALSNDMQRFVHEYATMPNDIHRYSTKFNVFLLRAIVEYRLNIVAYR